MPWPVAFDELRTSQTFGIDELVGGVASTIQILLNTKEINGKKEHRPMYGIREQGQEHGPMVEALRRPLWRMETGRWCLCAPALAESVGYSLRNAHL